MSVAYYIVLDVDEPDFDTFVDGKAVAHSYEEIDALCQGAGLPSLESFMGQSMGEFEDLFGEEIELPEGDDGGEKWFDPQEGILLLDSMITLISAQPAAISDSPAVLDDLRGYKAVLEQARYIKAKWHLALDF